MTGSRWAPTLAIAPGTLVLVLLGAAAGCASPEGQRTRGQGLGADIGNRNPIVKMHQGSKMYYDTPCLLPRDKCPGPLPVSGLPGDFPEPARRTSQ